MVAPRLFGADQPPAAKTDARYPFRTDFANENLAWYRPKPLEFPPHHSDHRMGGELVSVDFIHRVGQFRVSKTGELLDFAMPPYGAVQYLGAEADLRDVPLGTHFLFFLNQDANGRFTRLVAMQDQFTMDAGHGFTYRLDEAKLTEGKLLVTKHSLAKKLDDLGKEELYVTSETRLWKADKRVGLNDLTSGDELLYNVAEGVAGKPDVCTDIWIGVDTHQLATEQQHQKFAAFTKDRGLPGWLEQTDGNQLTVTLFSGDAKNFNKNWMDDFARGKGVRVVVANDELRTWNPPVDNEYAQVLEVRNAPTDCYGCSGVTLVLKVNNMLEGFRKGRIVRVFGAGWKTKDQFYGESLMGYGYGRLQTEVLKECTPKEYPEQFPFRTDYGNAHLPWLRLKPGVPPPRFSEHVVIGELVKVDDASHTGQFRTDRTGELVDFTLIPEGKVKYVNGDAALTDIPLGTRCRFDLYQDEHGAFTQATFVRDEFTYLADNAITWRVESLRLDKGTLQVAWQIPEVKNYNGDMERPPDIGRCLLRVSEETRVWRGDQRVALTDLAIGDALLVNMTGEQPGTRSRCTDIWVGADTHKFATAFQQKKYAASQKK